MCWENKETNQLLLRPQLPPQALWSKENHCAPPTPRLHCQRGRSKEEAQEEGKGVVVVVARQPWPGEAGHGRVVGGASWAPDPAIGLTSGGGGLGFVRDGRAVRADLGEGIWAAWNAGDDRN